MVKRNPSPKSFFTKEEKERIVLAIREAESRTSGEIRVYLERKAKGELLERARKVFDKIGMTRTRLRNGVLIYLSLKDRQFAVLGDRGIHEKVGPGFWDEAAILMAQSFSRGEFTAGLLNGIHRVGDKLQTFFPHKPGDVNELPDKVEE